MEADPPNSADSMPADPVPINPASMDFSPSDSQSSGSVAVPVETQRVNAGHWKHAPDGALLDTYLPDADLDNIPPGQQNAVISRRDQISSWIDHLESRSRFIPYQYAINYDDERARIKAGQLGIRATRSKTNSKQISLVLWVLEFILLI